MLETYLKKHFHHSSFRIGQKEIIEDILNGKDVLAVLPTGSGKSLCYQLPAKLLKGTTIVVSPLISLMIDQVKELKAMQFKHVIALNSFMNYRERKSAYENLSAYKLIYLSPELLNQHEMIQYLQKLKIDLFVIDEAHCISQWGHEFRPDYLKLYPIINQLGNPPILCLSATTTEEVQQDIMRSLKRINMVKHIYPIDKRNITYSIKEVINDHEKLSVLEDTLNQYHVPTLVYFSSRNVAERVTTQLSELFPERNIAYYHGGMEQIDRISVQQQFMNDQIHVICCTSAFGMGINKSNIRLIIHYHTPNQLESFIQEVGRAGRDGKWSLSLLLYAKQDEYIPKAMIEQELPNDKELHFVFQQLYSLYSKSLSIPSDTTESENVFNINEIKWRFISAQLEKNGMIEGTKIHYEPSIWKKAIQSIINYRDERLMFKYKKLDEMFSLFKQHDCIRKILYTTFQPSYENPLYDCCSHCGLTHHSFPEMSKEIKTEVYATWQDKLKMLLHRG